jgi:hypothetical protein
MPQQRGGVRTVGPVAVVGFRSGLGGVGHEGVRTDVYGLEPAAAERAWYPGRPHAIRKGIVAAGVEQDQAQPLDRLQRPDDAVERHRLVVHVVGSAELRVDRHQIIRPADLDAVTGIVDDGDVGSFGGQQEFAHGAPEIHHPEILAQNHGFEARLAEELGEPDRVGDRIGERRGVAVSRVSDDQRDASVRGGWVCGEHRHEQAKTGEKRPCSHHRTE